MAGFYLADRDLDAGHSGNASLGIVGCGPRGLFCLERLVSELDDARGEGRTYDITVFEPSPWPGAGKVYDLRQGEYLKINYGARNIDVWSLRKKPRPPSLVEWVDLSGDQSRLEENYVPRAIAGDYLHTCFETVVSELIALGCSIRIFPHEVERVEPNGQGVALRAKDRWYQFQTVVLATGHEGWRGGGGSTRFPHEQGQFVRSVYPVDEMLCTARLPPNCRVATRGFSLCFIDAALALTQGRGGRFVETPTGKRYQESGYEPHAIFPFCRSGRPMRCKPEYQKMSLPAGIRAVWKEGRERISSQVEKGEISFEESVWPNVVECAQRALQLCDVEASVSDWWDDWLSMGSDPWEVFDEMRRACNIASGRSEVDAGWALGESWRQLYTAFSRRIEFGGLKDGEWETFWDRHQEMERIAFGPPLVNLEKIVALVGAGRIRLDAVESPKYEYESTTHTYVSSEKEVEVDAIVDAVLPGPREFSESSLLKYLIGTGVARRDPASGAVEVGRDGALVDVHGKPSSILFYFGRATEGWILGNDSLCRRQGEGIAQWAARFSGGISELASGASR